MVHVLTFLAVVSCTLALSADAFATPNSDFLLGIDGTSITTGHGHTCVLEQKSSDGVGGRAHCWGDDSYEDAMDAPKDMEFVQIVAGDAFTCGLTIDQTVFCWGSVSGYIPGLYEQISAAGYGNTACGVLTDGKINCWGYEKLTPHRPSDTEARYVQVSCARVHCCALDSNAYPHCWSAVGDTTEIRTPTITYSQYLAAAKGPGVDMAVLAQVGAGSPGKDDEEEDFEASAGGKRATSVSETGDETISKIQFRQVSVGEGQSCGITLLGGHMHCWGGNPKKPLRSNGPYRQVSVGRRGVCAITASSETDSTWEADMLKCWGFADTDVHYSGGTEDSAASYRWDQVTVGSTSICAVTMDSELKCWGGGTPPEFTARGGKFIVA